MERFDFFFGLHLGGRLHSHADNLSKDLKGTKVAAVSGQGLTLAYLTKETLKKCPVIKASTISMLMFRARVKACLVNHRFHWKRCTSARLEVGVGAPSYPKLPKITLEGSIMRLLILSSVLSIRKASAPTPRWRPSWLKLLMVTDMRQSSSFLKPHTEKMLIQGRYLGMQLSILEVML